MKKRRRKNQYIFAGEQPRSRVRGFFTGLVAVLLAAALITAGANFVINHQVTLLQQKVTVQNLPDSLENWSILHMSDLHGQTVGLDHSAVRKAISGMRYSCVVFTGDMVGEGGDVQPLLDIIALLPPETPKLLVPGDSDPPMLDPTAHGTLSVYTDWAQQLADAGVILLDEPVCFTRGEGRTEGRIWFVPASLYSLDIPAARAAYQTQLDALNANATSLDADQAALKRVLEYHVARLDRTMEAIASMKDTDIQIAVTHAPFTNDHARTLVQAQSKTETFALRKVSLILAGHYAGGQWRLPGLGPVYVPDYGWFPDDGLIHGFNYVGSIPQYISGGLAASPWYPWQPFRLFNGPEITYIALTARMI